MSDASITTLGIGSGLELQSILDQLQEVDRNATVTPKETSMAELEKQLDEFTVVKNKLLDMKSAALNLSLNSTFTGRTATSTDEDVFSVLVADSTAVQTTSVTVDRLATKSSWLSSGVSASSDIIYVPTSQESTTGVTDPAAAGFITANDTLEITFGETGSEVVVSVDVTTGMSMNDVIDAINNDNENGGGAPVSEFVTAESFLSAGETFLRIRSTAGGNGETERVAITTQLDDVVFAAPDDVFEFEFGPTGDTTTISINVAADTTLSGLATLINDHEDNPGVTATVIDDGAASDPFKLLLEADDTGEDKRIAITDSTPDITFTEQQGAAAASLNSQVTMGTIAYQRQTNTINDVLTGVTFTLESVGTSTVKVSDNNDVITGFITDMVEAYNDAVEEINSNVEYDDETGEFGILASTSLRDIPNTLEDLLTTTIEISETSLVGSLFDLGLAFETDGTVTIDETLLDAALTDNASDVSAFFLGDSDEDIDGLGDTINDMLRTITIGSGQIEAEKAAANVKIDDLEVAIESATERLDKKYDNLTKQFIQLDQYMNQMSGLSSYLTSQFDSLSSMWSSSKDK